MNLCIDIGNSLVKTAVFSGTTLLKKTLTPGIGKKELDKLQSDFPGITSVILCNVRPDDSHLVAGLESRFTRLIVFNENTSIPFTNLYKTGETLGKDRLAAVAGANNNFPGRNVLVVDAGTAITYDLIDESNKYIGGNISPGMAMRFRALHEFTGKLPLVSPSRTDVLLADNTKEAIVAGVQNGIVFEMESYICRLKKQYSDLKIIFTGGDASYFDKKLKYTIFVDPDLIVTGLNRILTYNVDKK